MKMLLCKCLPRLEARREGLLQAIAIFSGFHPLDQILTQGSRGLAWIESKVHPVFQSTPSRIDKRDLQGTPLLGQIQVICIRTC